MKKTILVESLLFFSVAVILYPWIIYLMSLNSYILGGDFDNGFSVCLAITILLTLCLLFTLIAMIIIAIKDISAFKTLIDKIKTKYAEKKASRAEKSKAAKLARIEKLETELEKLKND